MENRMAPNGFIWVCQMCGKQSLDLYGEKDYHSYGWDASCVINAELESIKKHQMET